MKWLLAPFLWLLALALTALLLWRLWRGKPVVLRGRWSPRVIRLVAVLLVFLGFTSQAPAAARDLLLALREAEGTGLYDPWLAAYLWRQAGRGVGEPADRVELFAALAEHARKANALVQARPKGQHLLMGPRAWMSKAG